MPTRIRLQRKGKKGKPYYHLVVADQRSPRDGKYIERIGAYDPNRNPALVEVDREKAVDWLQQGAQPSDTARAILSYSGAVYKNHLLNGVKKGAFDQEEADRRFDAWMNEKKAKVEAKRASVEDAAAKSYKERLAAETKKSNDRADALTARLAATIPVAGEEGAEVPTEEAAPAEAGAEAAPEAKAEETPAAESKEAAPEAKAEEAPAAEAKEAAPEAKAEESPAAESKEAAPEAKAEEAPAAESKEAAPEAKTDGAKTEGETTGKE